MNLPVEKGVSPAPRWAVGATVGWTSLSVLWLFSPGLFFDAVPAFRDGYHFYYPQAVWLEEQRQQGVWFPAWNHHESLGVSTVGQPNTALFYPLRPLWWLPGLSMPQRYALFLGVHVVLAGWGATWAAERAGAGRSAPLAGIGYALSTPVLFQHSNLIYLCSAAWLGWTMGMLVDLLRGRVANGVRGVATAGGLAMMVLAGDAHTAVNMLIVIAGCLAARAAAGLWRPRRPAGEPNSRESASWSAETARNLAWLVAVTGIVVGLTWPQWTATMAWIRVAEPRAETTGPSGGEPAGTPSGRTGPTRRVESIVAQMPETPRGSFQFSLPPWHLLTLVWPTLGGHFLPEHSRWWARLPAESRMWLPSLYLGTMPCLLLFFPSVPRAAGRSVDRPLRTSSPMVWLVGVAVAACIFALGNYSVLWLVKQILLGLDCVEAAESLPPDWWASPYWWLMRGVPGYDLFRYPAKWCSILTVAAAIAAACRMQGFETSRRRRTGSGVECIWRGRRMCLLGVGSLLILGLAGVYRLVADHVGFSAGSDPWFGAPRPASVFTTMVMAAGWPWVALGIVRALGRAMRSMHNAILIGTWLEMTLIAGAWVQFAPPPSPPGARAAFRATEGDSGGGGAKGRSVRADPASWQTVWCDPTEARFGEDVLAVTEGGDFVELQTAYQTRMRLGKLGLLLHEHNLAAIQSLPDWRIERLKGWLIRHDTMDIQQPGLERILRELGVQARLARRQHRNGKPELVWVPIPNPAPLCQLFETRNPDAEVRGGQVAWQWSDCQTLHVAVDTPVEAVLLVRQVNSGRVQVDSLHPQTHRRVTTLRCPAGPLFVEQPVPAGKCRLVFRFR